MRVTTNDVYGRAKETIRFVVPGARCCLVADRSRVNERIAPQPPKPPCRLKESLLRNGTPRPGNVFPTGGFVSSLSW
ncbi:hypothetical protein GCM10023317_16840 [Actinopolymorpha pittospori]